VFLRIASVAWVGAVITMEAGWVVSEVGRQPWIVDNVMRVGHRQHRSLDHLRARES
jgi:cytochrome d ubiquinol oxidase subunit I